MNGLCRLLALLLGLTAVLHAEPPLTTRVFKVPPDFFVSGGGASGGAAPADPFAAGVPETAPNQPPRKSAQEILEAQGITFPKGATASFDPATSLLTITNSQPNMDLVEAFMDSITTQSPKTIAYTLTVIEGPGELIRTANAAASKSANAAKELALLLDYAKNPGSNVRVVGDAYLETKSGTRATTAAVREHIYASAMELDAKSRPSVAQEMRPLGLRLELEPTLGADGITIESTVSIELHPAQPIERQVSITEPITGNAAEFPSTDVFGAHFTTGITSTSGSTKLLGITKPVGTPAEQEDILWAAFLTATVRQMATPPVSNPPTVATTVPVPPGLSATALHVPDGLFAAMMETPMPLPQWFESQGIPRTPGATARHEQGVLQIINTPANIERIAALIDEYLNQCAKTVAFTLHTVQAPAAFLRDLSHRAAATSDQTALWASLEAAAVRGEASFINSVFLETKSGNRATHEAVREHVYLSEFGTNAKGLPQLAFEMRQVGSIFQVEPTVGADGHTIEITFDYELHAAPPEARRDHFLDPAAKQRFDMPVSDFHTTKTTTSITMIKGGTQLISLHQPTGRDVPSMLWATFLKCNVVPQVAKPRRTKAELEPARKPSADPKAIHTRSFRVPPDFTSTGGDVTTADDQKRRKTAKTILEEVGIPFPEGTTVYYSAPTTRMIVTNTNENLDLVEKFFESHYRAPPTIAAFTTHILQGPGLLLRRLTAQAASKSDHHAELDALLTAVKAGTVQYLNTARIETKSGTRARTQQVREHSAISDVSVNDQGEPVFEQEMREVGLKIELEPTVGADGVTVEITIAPEFHTAAPFEHREHVIDTQGRRLEFPLTDYHTAKLTTGITLPDGTTRLLALYKPTGKPEFEKEDILQAIFITCDVLRVNE